VNVKKKPSTFIITCPLAADVSDDLKMKGKEVAVLKHHATKMYGRMEV
jgi:hypothetical protein